MGPNNLLARQKQNAPKHHRKKLTPAAKERDKALESLRERSRAIDSYVDMIPVRAYLAVDDPAVLEGKSGGLDPRKLKRTSEMVVKSALMDSSGPGENEGQNGKESPKQKKNNKKAKNAKESITSSGKSRQELHAKLAAKIAELKEARKKKEQEVDQARMAAITAAKAKAKAHAAKAVASNNEAVADDAEVGRLAFDTKDDSIPFEASVGRKGDKSRRMKTDIRKAEAEERKLQRAEAQGTAEDLRQQMGLEKALKRARGDKVHDDPSKLRKAQRALDAKRAKGHQKWEERKGELKDTMEEKQRKRKENLAKPRSKKAKMRSGFEGERGSGFINKEK
eukprot:CAMPEP_0206502934 /NCGR_PEP_ID=MMETSP0324_2-20121206/54351_1 /ASSEMBLY_ACC=CAM_ASM_000836 /TAXON_ID=2866 /ORGANISM="Crypthecodinium cohnii, Strain Seligo" /LENGTH=336 /DNA_ID=CAMNT_0053991339 /DNA_START=150 /DNA_END=1160 /DNA_ORIENTATION=+